MAERQVAIHQAQTKPRDGQRVPVLVVAWPPVRENGPWTLEVRAPREVVTARIVVPPIAFLDDPQAELLAEEFIKQKLPVVMHNLLLPGAVVAAENLVPLRPSDLWDIHHHLSLVRGLLNGQ